MTQKYEQPKEFFSFRTYTEFTIVYFMKKDEEIPLHNHFWDHWSVCAKGSVVIFGEARNERILTPADGPKVMPANVLHAIRALEDGTVLINTQSLRNTYLADLS